jgi:hypothetical protein
MEPQVIRSGIFNVQICVPKDWTDDQAKDFADLENPTGVSHGWSIQKEGCEALAGYHERVQCEGEGREDFIHIMLEC